MHAARGWRYKFFGRSGIGTGTGKTMAASSHFARRAIAICTLLTAALTSGMIALATKADDTAAAESDVVVIGGTPGGVAAAVVAARLGHSVTLVEHHARIGGMAASGLGWSDIEDRGLVQGFFREFVDRVKAHYVAAHGPESPQVALCKDGYQYPYRIMVPKRVDGLIAPVPASATHVAFSAIRMEPTWMALGQAAGIAAHLSIAGGTEIRRVPIADLQRILREQAAVMDLPE